MVKPTIQELVGRARAGDMDACAQLVEATQAMAYGAALGMPIGSASEQSLAFSDPAMDDFAGLNLLSIVVQVPKAKLASALGIPSNGTFFVWGTTSVR